MTRDTRYWVVVPAAGVGRRMGGEMPKQYLRLSGKRILDHTLTGLFRHPLINAVYLALSEDDPHWEACDYANDPRVIRTPGGKERCYSVLNALYRIADSAQQDDWVLVHDAARPCLSETDLNRLIENLLNHPTGGLLGVPVSDTLKRVSENGAIEATISRERLWRAFTPQMFRLGLLIHSLEDAIGQGRVVTDEASAMEISGYRPLMIEGEARNIKITRPEDLMLAKFYLG
ncbi:MAG: 2-C-methyl-D-erythritol 4-phosphate cytidylyltransferase [Candidatus Thiodiazotropha sp.]